MLPTLLYGFRWSERHGAFRHFIAGGAAASLSMVIAPAELDPLRAAAAMDRQRGDPDPSLAAALSRPPPPLPQLAGAKVSSPDEAVSLAVEAYFRRAGGLRALQRAQAVGASSLGFDVPGFASTGDRVWEVRVYEGVALSAVIWVNAETGRAHVLAP